MAFSASGCPKMAHCRADDCRDEDREAGLGFRKGSTHACHNGFGEYTSGELCDL